MKVVQLITRKRQGLDDQLIALCDDGSIFEYDSFARWKELPVPESKLPPKPRPR